MGKRPHKIIFAAVFVGISITLIAGAPRAQSSYSQPPYQTGDMAQPNRTDQQDKPDSADQLPRLEQARRIIREHQEQVRLNRIMEVEGPEFSPVRYERYRRRRAGGTVLIVFGAAGLICAPILAIAADPIEFIYDDDADDTPPDSGLRAFAWASLIGGTISLGVGVPLLVSGIRGKHRQIYLLDHGPPHPSARHSQLSLSLSANPLPNGGGFSLNLMF